MAPQGDGLSLYGMQAGLSGRMPISKTFGGQLPVTLSANPR